MSLAESALIAARGDQSQARELFFCRRWDLITLAFFTSNALFLICTIHTHQGLHSRCDIVEAPGLPEIQFYKTCSKNVKK